MKRKEMSLLPREELRQLRWQFLATIPKTELESWRLNMNIKRVNAELAVRAQKIVKNESRET
jgi:hypothetical protein